ncbi:MAG: hypothetical protein WBQ95_15685 [Terracidiphilus sp.]
MSTLLSKALVAFTIEFDNEFEHRVPHRTTDHGGARSDPFLVSMVMWYMILRFVPEQGITAGELKVQSGLSKKQLRQLLERMSKWWGYVSIDPVANQSQSALVIRPTTGGLKAITVWRELTGIIELRWQKRFGHDLALNLQQSLEAVAVQLDPHLPDYLPVLGYELKSQIPEDFQPPRSLCDQSVALPILLSRVLLAFAIEFEAEANLSLAVYANFLRLAAERDIRVKDLPRLSGVPKEAAAMALDRLERQVLAKFKTESPTSRFKVLSANAFGREKAAACADLLQQIEARWQERFGAGKISSLRSSLEALIHSESSEATLLMQGIAPYPDNWRAHVPPREALPDFPMVLHRGGFPDGS